MQEEEKVRKDMGEDYVEKISRIMDEIDTVKIRIVEEPSLIVYLNNRLHSLFIKLSGKLSEKDINQQYMFNDAINKCHPFSIKKVTNEYNSNIKRISNPNLYKTYLRYCELREMHLNKVMEELGLTNIQERKQRRVH